MVAPLLAVCRAQGSYSPLRFPPHQLSLRALSHACVVGARADQNAGTGRVEAQGEALRAAHNP